jgi:peroxiredoxin
MARIEVNKQAPDFTSLDLNGNRVSLADFAGRMHVLLVFNRSFS